MSLVGATIHNMRGLLTPVTSSTQALLGRLEEGQVKPAELKKHLRRIVDATTDLGRLMDDVRRYSQQVPSERRRERLSSLIDESLENAKACFSQSGHDMDLIALRLDVPDHLTIDASKVHLVVALTNLLQNSFEAFKPVMDQVGPFWIAIHRSPPMMTARSPSRLKTTALGSAKKTFVRSASSFRGRQL
ncbi:MAG: hypothetical protein KatS3mg114_0851 [Planctomycetaceae bacterium]|nr:MAG: hypothetical protein KatS3mg114_0851 [Planctomycetaceae bacterium]